MASTAATIRPPGTVIKEGPVTKQGGRIKTWKKRWCVLTDQGLTYYKVQQSNYNNMQGQIELSTIEGVEAVTDKDQIKVLTPGRTYVISVENAEEQESWVSLVRQQRERFLANRRSAREDKEDTADSGEYNAKSVEDLETLLSSLDIRFHEEVAKAVDATCTEKDELIEELMLREIASLRAKHALERVELATELQRRGA